MGLFPTQGSAVWNNNFSSFFPFNFHYFRQAVSSNFLGKLFYNQLPLIHRKMCQFSLLPFQFCSPILSDYTHLFLFLVVCNIPVFIDATPFLCQQFYPVIHLCSYLGGKKCKVSLIPASFFFLIKFLVCMSFEG